jgi:hypothetical protein
MSLPGIVLGGDLYNAEWIVNEYLMNKIVMLCIIYMYTQLHPEKLQQCSFRDLSNYWFSLKKSLLFVNLLPVSK